MALEVGTNAYVNADDADTYFGDRLNASNWSGATADEKDQALVTATLRLDQLTFKGARTDSSQPLAWPRWGVKDEDGYLLDSDTVPDRINRATMELALSLLNAGTTDSLADTGLEGFDSVKVGPITVDVRHRKQTLPDHVRREVAPLLRTNGGFEMVRG